MRKVMNISITPFRKSSDFALEINDFEPVGGYENFIKNFCKYIGAEFLDWYQGWWDGLGHINIGETNMRVFWTDFPLSLSFDCSNKTQAEILKKKLEAFFKDHEIQ